MALLGSGAVIIWNGITDAARADFFGWHNREHILERVSTPGFHRGRRYVALDATPEFFTFYEVADPAVLSGQAYLDRLSAPTPWTKRVVPGFTDTARALTHVVLTRGLGQGGILATVRFDPAGGAAERIREALEHEADDLLRQNPEIVGLHLCLTDLAASNVVTEERKARDSATDVPEAAVLVEGTDEATVRALVAGYVLPVLAQALPVIGLYRHELTISRDEIG